MKTLFFFSFMLMILLASCGGSVSKPAQNEVKENLKISLKVGGMTCDGCEKTIETGVAQLQGIKSVDASFKDSTVVVALDTTLVHEADIKATIAKLGYSPE
jgi:copper chaperone CopZ